MISTITSSSELSGVESDLKKSNGDGSLCSGRMSFQRQSEFLARSL